MGSELLILLGCAWLAANAAVAVLALLAARTRGGSRSRPAVLNHCTAVQAVLKHSTRVRIGARKTLRHGGDCPRVR